MAQDTKQLVEKQTGLINKYWNGDTGSKTQTQDRENQTVCFKGCKSISVILNTYLTQVRHIRKPTRQRE